MHTLKHVSPAKCVIVFSWVRPLCFSVFATNSIPKENFHFTYRSSAIFGGPGIEWLDGSWEVCDKNRLVVMVLDNELLVFSLEINTPLRREGLGREGEGENKGEGREKNKKKSV